MRNLVLAALPATLLALAACGSSDEPAPVSQTVDPYDLTTAPPTETPPPGYEEAQKKRRLEKSGAPAQP